MPSETHILYHLLPHFQECIFSGKASYLICDGAPSLGVQQAHHGGWGVCIIPPQMEQSSLISRITVTLLSVLVYLHVLLSLVQASCCTCRVWTSSRIFRSDSLRLYSISLMYALLPQIWLSILSKGFRHYRLISNVDNDSRIYLSSINTHHGLYLPGKEPCSRRLLMP